MPADTEICCCRSSCWTKTIGWLQTVGGFLGVVGMAMILANFDKTQFSQELEEIRPTLWAILVCALVEFILSFIFGIILVVGTAKEDTSLMWAWIVFESALVLSSMIARMVAAKDVGYGRVGPAVTINLLIFAFMVRCVRCRIRDVKAAQGVKPCEEAGK